MSKAFSLMHKKVISLPGQAKRSLAFTFDLLVSMATAWVAVLISSDLKQVGGNAWILYLLAPALMCPMFLSSGIYRAVSRYTGLRALMLVVRVALLYGFAFLVFVIALRLPGVSLTVGILQPMMFLLMAGGGRVMVRLWFVEPRIFTERQAGVNRMMIYGAGKAGIEIARALQQHHRFLVVGFFDDDPGLQGRTIDGLHVYDPARAQRLFAELGIRTLLIAVPSASRSRRNDMLKRFQDFPVSLKTLPGIDELADGRVSVSDIKEVEIEELLGRDPVPVDSRLVEETIAGKVVMVTGAGGSIGSELCRQILSARPIKLLLLENTEYNLFSIHAELEQRLAQAAPETRIIPLLCDVCDAGRVDEICRVFAPTVIYHAAAYKHVPMVEHNPAEGVRNNVFGTLAIVDAAMRFGVSSLVLISTDKAVRPTNVMGASKRLCEMILQAYAAQNDHATNYSMVRFGNVLGSSGSVVPIFRSQISAGGPITITHEEITRYFMTISEAAQLVLQAGAMAAGGDVFLLDMGEPVKIVDLARRMIELSGLSVCDEDHPDGDIEILVTGLRPGEKLYEELLIRNNPEPTANPRIFRAREHYTPLEELRLKLSQLADVVKCNDVVQMKNLLKELVVEYRMSDAVADYLLMEDEIRSRPARQTALPTYEVKRQVNDRLMQDHSAQRYEDDMRLNGHLVASENV